MPRLRGAEEHREDMKKMREFISEYKVCKLEQFDRYLYDKEPKIKKYIRDQMVKRNMMFISDGMCSAEPDWHRNYDAGMIKALWVMLDFCEESDYNSVANFPTKLRFSKDGDVYDVCVAEPGKENTINLFYGKFCNEPSKFIVVVEDKEQMMKLDFEGIIAYCIVNDDGRIIYYRKEG